MYVNIKYLNNVLHGYINRKTIHSTKKRGDITNNKWFTYQQCSHALLMDVQWTRTHSNVKFSLDVQWTRTHSNVKFSLDVQWTRTYSNVKFSLDVQWTRTHSNVKFSLDVQWTSTHSYVKFSLENWCCFCFALIIYRWCVNHSTYTTFLFFFSKLWFF